MDRPVVGRGVGGAADAAVDHKPHLPLPPGFFTDSLEIYLMALSVTNREAMTRATFAPSTRLGCRRAHGWTSAGDDSTRSFTAPRQTTCLTDREATTDSAAFGRVHRWERVP